MEVAIWFLLLSGGEGNQPSAFPFEGANEAFTEAILLGSIGSCVFLRCRYHYQRPVAFGAEDQPDVVTEHLSFGSSMRPLESGKYSFFQSAFDRFGASGGSSIRGLSGDSSQW